MDIEQKRQTTKLLKSEVSQLKEIIKKIKLEAEYSEDPRDFIKWVLELQLERVI